ncbi:MAG: M50 family metallopeptidase [Nanoarchaeota archaeon]|mgnify:CR=1 FL=1
MAFISLLEIVYLVILTFIIGYIFSGFIKRPATEHEIVYEKGFNWEDFKLATIVAAPAVILHELGHKFSAILFGLDAVLHLFWEGLGLAVFLKLINSPFLIIAPAYVSISGKATEFQSFITAFSGPLVNLVLFFGAWIILERMKLTRKQAISLYLTKQINLLLFIFNMLPIPPLDGFSVFTNLFRIIF